MGRASGSEATRRGHWDDPYKARGPDEVTWFQEQPAASLGLIAAAGLDRSATLIDVGGGAARQVDHLLADGWSDLTVLDLSSVALNGARMRVGPNPHGEWIEHDLLTWQPTRRYDVRHAQCGPLHVSEAPTGHGFSVGLDGWANLAQQ